jgi:hypothetical protein
MGNNSSRGEAYWFRHHFINTDLPLFNNGDWGDYGQAILVDLDNNGKLDFVCGRGRIPGDTLFWFENTGDPDKWIKHIVGHEQWTDVGAAALDVDGDGFKDIICSGVWFKNPGNPREIGRASCRERVFGFV